MTETINANDPRYQQALDDFTAEFGMRLQDMLLPTHYVVALADGKPTVCFTRDGMRAMALTAPRPGAVELVEGLIAQIESRRPS